MDLEGIVQPHDLSGYSRTLVKSYAACPICDANAAIESSAEDLQVVGIGRVEIGYGYCGDCGHIYQVRPVPDTILAKYYSRFSNYTVQHPASAKLMPPSAMTRRLLSIARDNFGGAGSIFEVGCATGAHLNQFKWACWQVSGCDPSPKACAQAKEIYGLDVECGLEADALLHQHNLDIVLFSGVLEHLSDPRGALQRARAALKHDGMVLVEVPCATSPESLPPGWLAFEHLQYYSHDSLKALLNKSGFELVEARISYRDFIYPVITAVAQRSDSYTFSIAPSDGHAGWFATTYQKRDAEMWDAARAKIKTLEGAFVVWGAGIHTSQLMDRIPECVERISRFVDSDLQKQDATLAGKLVTSPASYYCSRTLLPIVISSYAKEREICHELLENDVPEALIIRLYA